MRLQANSKTGLPMLQGSRYRATHQASVDAVLGSGVRRVFSRGGRFFNKDRWPLRTFVVHFCAWVSQNRGRKTPPSLADIQAMCDKANAEHVSDPQIVIAATPEKLPLPVALALIGGGYHEAWHTKYSRRRDVNAREMKQIIDAVWGRMDDWSKFGKAILDWSNIVEDIRIERAGCNDFPGARPKMEDLQGFILDQEETARQEALNKGMAEADLNRAQTVISGTFRDVGLGYNTERQRRAFDAYIERNAVAVKFVIDGPLSDLLRETIALGAKDDTACLRIAMEVLATIMEASQEQSQDSDDQQGQGQGQGGQVACPNCGSPNVKAKKVGPGKGLLVCGRCGYQEEIDLSDDQQGGQGSGQGIEMEQDDSDDDQDGQGGQSGQQSDSKDGGKKDSKSGQKGSQDDSDDSDGSQDGDEDEDGEGGSQGGESDEDEDAEGEGQGGSDSEAGDEAEGEDEGQGSEGGDDSDDTDGEQDGKGSDSDEQGDASDSSGDADEGGQGAGGHQGDPNPIDGWDFAAEVANGYLEDAEGENGLKDSNEALEDAFDAGKEQEDDRCKHGEAAYRPYDASLDPADFAQASRRGKADDATRAQDLLSSVRSECAYLRSRLRNIVKAVEQTNVEHGTRRGRGLSERMFVDDVACIRSGQMPNRAYFDEETQIDTSMAAAIVLDESGSMSSRLQLATQAMLAITEPLDALGCAVMAVGFRDGNGYADTSDHDGGNYFRTEAVHIDVFKAFGESFRSTKWRFANTRATGGTPMADGIQYALEGLNERREAHRVIFIVTDGEANYDHRPVIKRQIRLAREAGIQIIGVGIGSGASYVKTMFDDSVYTTTLSDLPQKLVQKLNQLLDFRGLKRGRRVKTA